MNAHAATDRTQWVVVTGAASGIGAGVARVVADAGYGVILADLDEARLVSLASELPLARAVVVDVTDEASVDTLASTCRDVGDVWGLVNCAGVALVKHFLLNTAEEWTRVLRVNLEGTMRTTHAMARVMDESCGGAIVNISSISGVTPAALQASYAASKAGVIGFTTGVAFDLGPLDITVNALCPGVVRTPIWERILEAESAETGRATDDIFAEHLRPIPVGRAQTADDIGNAVVFLLGPHARNISGTSINITGGMTTVVLDHAAGAQQYRDSLS
jgi:meso-butanediol dehydrogenase/(S,S)-butanediol dehydrogenase/diacetyl reductase